MSNGKPTTPEESSDYLAKVAQDHEAAKVTCRMIGHDYAYSGLINIRCCRCHNVSTYDGGTFISSPFIYSDGAANE